MDVNVLVQLGPELILLVGALVALIVGATRASLRSTIVSPLAIVVVVVALLASLRLGVPHGENTLPGLWLSSLTYYTRCITLVIGVLIILVNWHQPVAEERGEYMGLILFSLLGVLLTASANDLVLLFFAIELVSIPTYVLIALSRTDRRAPESAVKYFFLGAMAAAVLAYGLSFLYGAAGTTAIRHVGATWSFDGPMGTQALIGLILVFAGLAFKIAAVPLHVYAADVYEGAASPITGMLGFVPKFAGFVALVKVFNACQWNLPESVCWLIWVVAALTMTAGNVLALLQQNVKRMLAYSSIAHTGYMLIALLVGPVAGLGPMHDGIAALLFYIAVYGAMNLGAFAALSAFSVAGRSVETVDDLAGLHRRAPIPALALAVCAFSLMGFPPTAGFVGKLYIFSSVFSLDASHAFRDPLIALAIIGVLNSAVGAAYYLRIAATIYIRPELEEVAPAGGGPVRWGLALCSIPMLVLFAWPSGLAIRAQHATQVLRASTTPGNVATALDVTPSDVALTASTTGLHSDPSSQD